MRVSFRDTVVFVLAELPADLGQRHLVYVVIRQPQAILRLQRVGQRGVGARCSAVVRRLRSGSGGAGVSARASNSSSGRSTASSDVVRPARSASM